MSSDDHGHVVFAAYRPHAGKEAALRAIVDRHFPALRQAGLVTDRAPIIVQAVDGTILDVFEWKDADASRKAHEEPTIKALWGEMMQIADMIAPGYIPEMQQRFPHFTPLDSA